MAKNKGEKGKRGGYICKGKFPEGWENIFYPFDYNLPLVHIECEYGFAVYILTSEIYHCRKKDVNLKEHPPVIEIDGFCVKTVLLNKEQTKKLWDIMAITDRHIWRGTVDKERC